MDIWRIQLPKLVHVVAKEFFRRTLSYFPDKVDSIVKGKMIIPIEGYISSDLYYAAVLVIF